MENLICFSHLRWDFVWQRPQHLLTRLSRTFKIYFVEEPLALEEIQEPELEVLPTPANSNIANSNIIVIRLLLPDEKSGWIAQNSDKVQAVYNEMLQRFLKEQDITRPLIWFYTPMALDFLEIIPAYKLLIYDVMDQLAAFFGAPAGLAEREEKLLGIADIVLTGGISLYRSKAPFNKNTYLFPSGVEIEHYATAANSSNFKLPADLEGLKRPIIGYFGVIDERIDQPLLAFIAQSRPKWTILMIGPYAKIDPATLPQADNLHYIGMRNYKELPSYLAFFDVAMIPFALNEATEYLSPTKTLEYLAAGKPVVSTPIKDVIELYGEVVRVAATHADFVRQIEAALSSDPGMNTNRVKEILNQATWDSIAGKITGLIQEKIRNV